MGFATHAHSGPQGGPSSGPGFCPIAPPNQPDPGTFAHRWGGLVRRIVTLDGERVWTGEDGGRIRRGTAQFDAGLGQWTTDWSFAQVPLPVRGIVRGLHMHSDGLRGWAVSSDGWVIKTIDGGQVWKLAERIPGAFGLTEWEHLYDIFMAENGLDGWLVGHHGIWYTDSGGICWQPAALYDHHAGPMTAQYIHDHTMELYAIDVLMNGPHLDCSNSPGPSPFLGLVVGQPGFVFRSLDMGRNWHMVMGISDFCSVLSIQPCPAAACGHASAPPWIELWDVQISRNGMNTIALIVGGVGTNCGLVYRSDDLGCSWEREFHECDGSAGDPNLNCTQAPEYNENSPPFRHMEFKTLYGVAIDALDNTAIAAGYNCQHLRRDFLAGGTPIWRDRSSFAMPNQWLANPSLDVTVYPLLAAATGRIGSQRLDWLSGMGGHIRGSDVGGEIWDHRAPGDAIRLRDAWFKPGLQPTLEDRGWRAGQHFNLEFSINGGATWNRFGAPGRIFPGTEQLTSIAFAGNGLNGVTVGTSVPGPTSSAPREGPRILRTPDFGANGNWTEPQQVSYVDPPGIEPYRTAGLRRAAWAKDTGNQHFWAVGDLGLVLRSTDGGFSWTQVPLPTDISLQGVAASAPNAVAVVGFDASQGVALYWNGSSWNSITVDPQIENLVDVAIHGSQMFAVGHRRLPNQELRGEVLHFAPGQNEFLPFVPPVPVDLVPCPQSNVALSNQAVTRVAVTSNYDVWVGGVCGMVWQYVHATSSWVEHKSQTSSDVRGMMFLSPDAGYVTADGGDGVNQVLVRYRKPE